MCEKFHNTQTGFVSSQMMRVLTRHQHHPMHFSTLECESVAENDRKGVTGVQIFPKYMSISFLKMNVNIQIVFYKYNNIYHQCLTFRLQSFII